jgi:hypothetical protein
MAVKSASAAMGQKTAAATTLRNNSHTSAGHLIKLFQYKKQLATAAASAVGTSSILFICAVRCLLQHVVLCNGFIERERKQHLYGSPRTHKQG